MRKYFYIFLGALLVLTGISSQAFAATMVQTADGGPYNVAIDAKIQVKKEGKDRNFSDGQVVITADSDTTGDFALDDEDNSIGIVTGTLTMLKGKKVTFEVDAAGLDVIEATIIDWITNFAASEGVTVTNADITFDVPIKTGKFKVDKTTGIPKGKAKLKLKGLIRADADGDPISRKIKYQVKVEF